MQQNCIETLQNNIIIIIIIIINCTDHSAVNDRQAVCSESRAATEGWNISPKTHARLHCTAGMNEHIQQEQRQPVPTTQHKKPGGIEA